MIDEVKIVPIAHPIAPDSPEPLAIQALQRLAREYDGGDPELCETPEHYATLIKGTEYVAGEIALAYEGEEPIGYAWIELTLVDNLDKANTLVVVHPQYRGRGVGTALEQWVEERALALGRTEIFSYIELPVPSPDDVLLEAPDGGSIPLEHPIWQFMANRRFQLADIEVLNCARLPYSEETLSALEATLPETPGYTFHTWFDSLPERYYDDYARLMEAASVDVPSGDVNIDRENWDAERVSDQREVYRRNGKVFLTTAVEKDGHLVGLTELIRYRQHKFLDQEYTIVLRGNRGRRLGLNLKLRNIRAAEQHWPDAQRMYTSNASENASMLAINDLLGFKADREMVAAVKRLG
jgi:GNAT superfamily N-acetyltransferase